MFTQISRTRRVRRAEPSRSFRRRWMALTTVTAAVASLAICAPAPAHAAVTITVDGTKPGRTFDGIGAISGGGGNSRLLLDYPAQQRNEILDYLFKPGYGAALQMLKVEIGGDTNSTDGAEPSHMHTATDENYQRGYEWWLMEQAKARNPNIKLAALAWGAPGWIGVNDPNNPSPGKPYFWSADMITYLVKWLQHAKSDHNLTIDYIGGWNERGYDKSWYARLKSALVANGLAAKIVGADSWGWEIANDLATDATFKNAVDVVGVHYPCGYLADGSSCPSSRTAQRLNKPLWASENGSQDYNSGAAAAARAVNRGYIDGKMTSFINWPVMAALYQNLFFSSDGLVVANQPWSGAYSVGKTAWVLAHTTQFTQPGWRYIDSASGFLGSNRTGGSYVTLTSTGSGDYSSVIETIDATADQTATFTVTGGLSTGTVHVWATNLRSSNPSDHFVHTTDVTPSGGSFSVTLKPGYVYTLTTTTGQEKGTATAPARASLGLPYADDFDSYAAGEQARYVSAMNGAFETAACGGGRAGTCLRQTAVGTPVRWTDEPYFAPYAQLGDLGWADYTISADTLLEQAGYVELLGRVGQQGRNNNGLNAYHLRVSDTGAWSIQRSDTSWSFTTIASGTTTPLGTNRWHNLALSLNGSTLTARLDGADLGSVNDTTFSSGQPGLGVGGHYGALFDNVRIDALSNRYAGTTYKIINRNSGKVLDVAGGSTADGAAVVQNTDTGSAAQQWQLTGDASGYLKVVNAGSGKVLEVPNASTTAGVQLDQWTDTGGTNQQWRVAAGSDGYVTITGRGSGLLADVESSSTADGARVVQWPDTGAANQRWALVPVSGRFVIANGTSDKVMDVSGASTVDGGKVVEWPANSGTNQQWSVANGTGGYVKLTNVNSGKVLDVPGLSTADGTELVQWTDNGGAGQQWRLTPLPGGTFQVTNRNSGKAVDLQNGSIADGTPITQQTATTAASQQWLLYSLT